MPRGGPLIMQDFILPALEKELYGPILKWVSREMKIFRLKLMHKNNSLWSEEKVQVFMDWDKLKKRPLDGSSTDSKQRFKNALRKCVCVRQLLDDEIQTFGINQESSCLYYMYEPKKRRTMKKSKAKKDAEEDDIKIMYSHGLTPPTSPESVDANVLMVPSNDNQNISFGESDYKFLVDFNEEKETVQAVSNIENFEIRRESVFVDKIHNQVVPSPGAEREEFYLNILDENSNFTSLRNDPLLASETCVLNCQSSVPEYNFPGMDFEYSYLHEEDLNIACTWPIFSIEKNA